MTKFNKILTIIIPLMFLIIFVSNINISNAVTSMTSPVILKAPNGGEEVNYESIYLEYNIQIDETITILDCYITLYKDNGFEELEYVTSQSFLNPSEDCGEGNHEISGYENIFSEEIDDGEYKLEISVETNSSDGDVVTHSKLSDNFFLYDNTLPYGEINVEGINLYLRRVNFTFIFDDGSGSGFDTDNSLIELYYGDGESKISASTSEFEESLIHNYPTNGFYNVTLNITDDAGNKNTFTKQIEINSPYANSQTCGIVVTTIILESNITTNSTCFIYQNYSDFLFDGNGYSIIYTGNELENNSAILSNNSGIGEIRNVNLVDFPIGISIINSGEIVFSNSYITSDLDNSYGLYFENTYANLIENYSIYMYGENSIGVAFVSSFVNELLNNNIYSEKSYEVLFEGNLSEDLEEEFESVNVLTFENDYGNVQLITENLTIKGNGMIINNETPYEQNLFLGYNVLGFDYESFEVFPDDNATITFYDMFDFRDINYISLFEDYNESSEEILTYGNSCDNCKIIDFDEHLTFTTQLLGSYSASYNDFTAPNITNISSSPNPIENDGNEQDIEINFTSDKYPIVVNFVIIKQDNNDTTTIGEYVITNSSQVPFNFTLTDDLVDGDYNLTINVSDYYGNSNVYFVTTINVDTPASTSSSGGSGGSGGGSSRGRTTTTQSSQQENTFDPLSGIVFNDDFNPNNFGTNDDSDEDNNNNDENDQNLENGNTGNDQENGNSITGFFSNIGDVVFNPTAIVIIVIILCGIIAGYLYIKSK